MLIKICALSLVCTAAYLILSALGAQISFGAKLASTVLIGGALAVMAEPVIAEILSFSKDHEELGRYAGTVLRAVGIAVLSRLCADICRDCGESTLASGVEIALRLEILVLCIPLVREIIGAAFEMMDF